MTLFIIGFLIILVLGIAATIEIGDRSIMMAFFFIYCLFFILISYGLSINYYLDPFEKPIKIQKAIIKEYGAFLSYKTEGETEERAENVYYKLTEKPSHLLITSPKPSVWYFINFAKEKEEVYFNKEDLKKFL